MEGKPQKKTECFLIQEPDNLVRKIRQIHMEKKKKKLGQNVGQRLRGIGIQKEEKAPLTATVWRGFPEEAALTKFSEL